MSKSNERALLRSTALWAAFASLAAFGSASAQTPEPQAEPQSEAQETGDAEEEIVVTGSHIRRSEYTSSSPIQIITSEQSSLEGLMDTADVLYGSPAVSGSGQINNFFNGFVIDGGPGVNTVSLRGLGAIRTLVMMNGRRLNPAGTRGAVGAVDLNVIPESMIGRIEILKDGASSIYGSDAVAGVVNVITRTDLDGAILNGSVMGTFDGGGETYQIDGAFGRTFDRGNFTGSFEYYRRNELNVGDRDYLSCPQDYLFNVDTLPKIGLSITDERQDLRYDDGSFVCSGRILTGTINRRSGGTRRYVVNPGAAANPTLLAPPGFERVALSFAQVFTFLTPPTPGLPPGTPDQARYDAAVELFRQNFILTSPQFSALEDEVDAISPVERYSLFLTANYDLAANVEAYGEFLANRRESDQDGVQQTFFSTFSGLAFHPDNPFTNAGAPFGPAFADSTVLRPTHDAQTVDYYRTIVGLRGDLFGSNWNYDVYGQWGRSEGEYQRDALLTERLLAALGLNDDPDPGFDGLAFVGFCPAGSPAGCTPFNLFDPSYVATGVFPAGVEEFVRVPTVGKTTYEQYLIQGVVDGDLFRLPAGAVAVALGGEWRREEIDDTPSADEQAGNLFGQTSAGRTAGSDQVREVFAEVEVPILANVPLFEELRFEGSYRWTDYDSFGQGETYKLGLNWQISPEYRLRSTFGTSFRAPALFELFLANQTGFLAAANIDPCVDWGLSTNPVLRERCAADGLPEDWNGGVFGATIITGGGAGILDAETSEAFTAGFVWTPDWMGLSLALDYFEIEVNDQVNQFGAANILAACYLGLSDDFCTLFERQTADPTAPTFLQIVTVNDSFVNLDQQITRGLDLTAEYVREFSFGTFRLDAQATWTFEDLFNLFGGGVADFNGEIGDPDFVANLAARFDRGDWTFFWDVDMIGKASDTEDVGTDLLIGRFGAVPGFPAQVAYRKQYQEFTAYHDASIRYQTDTWTLQAGVANIFDETPPAVGTGLVNRFGNVAITSQNDILGRRAFASVSRRW